MKSPGSAFGVPARNTRAGFHTTQWSLVARAGSEDSPDADAALNDLCHAYWRPLYAEIRRRGHPPADAQDLTQEFFARLLRRNAFGRAEKEKGRFRSYLLAALDHLLTDDWRAKRAWRRGGGAEVMPLDLVEGESWFLEQPAPDMTAAQAFDQQWSLVLMDRALAALRDDYEKTGRAGLFDALKPFLAADLTAADCQPACERLAMTVEAFTVAAHRFRKRFRQQVRAQVEMTVADPAEAEAEMKYLFGV